jgi:hypothetical protein
MSEVLDKHNQFMNTMSSFNGMESMLSGHREEVPKIAPPIEQHYNPNANQGYPPNPNGYPPNPYGYPPNPYGYPPNPYGQGFPMMGNPFVQPKLEFSETLLMYHAKQMIKQMKLKDKLISTIPKEIFRAAYDKKSDKILIADFERTNQSRSSIPEGSELMKAYDRQDKVKKLDAIIKKNNDDEKEDEYLELIAIEQFKMEKEMGILKLPTLQEYWSMRRNGMYLDYSEFISDTVKGVVQEFGGGATDFFQTIKSMIMGG